MQSFIYLDNSSFQSFIIIPTLNANVYISSVIWYDETFLKRLVFVLLPPKQLEYLLRMDDSIEFSIFHYYLRYSSELQGWNLQLLFWGVDALLHRHSNWLYHNHFFGWLFLPDQRSIEFLQLQLLGRKPAGLNAKFNISPRFTRWSPAVILFAHLVTASSIGKSLLSPPVRIGY